MALVGVGLVSLASACLVVPDSGPPDEPGGPAGSAGGGGYGGSFGGQSGAAGGGSWSTCSADVPKLGACGFAEMVPPTPNETIEQHMTGAVLSSGVGASDGRCQGYAQPGGRPLTSFLLGEVEAGERVFSFSMLDGQGVEWHYAFRFAGDAAPPAIAAGDVVTVDFTYRGWVLGFSPPSGSITVRDAGSGLLVWAGQDKGLPAERTPPELILKEGASTCEGVDRCHAYSGFDVEAAVVEGDSAQLAVVPYGGRAPIRGFEVAQSGHQVTTGQGSQGYCSDFTGAPTIVMMRRLLSSEPAK